jgi:hypothetical protein
MTAPKDVSIYVKLNSFGVVFVSIIVLFIIYVGISQIAKTDYVYDKDEYIDYLNDPLRRNNPNDYLAYIGMANASFPPLMGILGGGFYFHNISLPVIRNS